VLNWPLSSGHIELEVSPFEQCLHCVYITNQSINKHYMTASNLSLSNKSRAKWITCTRYYEKRWKSEM